MSMKKNARMLLCFLLVASSFCGCQSGEQGENGKSAYQIWLDNGNSGTETDFLAWLKGAQGVDGVGIAEIRVDDNGNMVITLTNGTVQMVEFPKNSSSEGSDKVEGTPGLHYIKNSEKEEYSVVGLGLAESWDVVIPATYKGLPVTSIENEAFYRGYITSVQIPNSVTSIGAYAFAVCSLLQTVEIPDSVTSIGEYAFAVCSLLKTAKIPDSVTSIEEYAFAGCNLERLIIGDGIVDLPDLFGEGNVPAHFVIGANVQSIATYSLREGDEWVSFTVDERNTAYASIDGNLYTKDGKNLIRYAPQQTVSSFTVPEGVTTIKKQAFEASEYLTEIIIPNSVVDIEDGAFKECHNLTCISYGGYEYTGEELKAFLKEYGSGPNINDDHWTSNW